GGGVGVGVGVVVAAAVGVVAVGGLEVGDGQADLFEVVRRLDACGGLANLLDGGQEQADEDGDDGYHHQQLDQREGAAASHGGALLSEGFSGQGRQGGRRIDTMTPAFAFYCRRVG